MCVYVSAKERTRGKEREKVGEKEHALTRKKLTENEFEREEGRKGERQRVCECVYLRVCVFVYVYMCVFVNVGVCVCVCWHHVGMVESGVTNGMSIHLCIQTIETIHNNA